MYLINIFLLLIFMIFTNNCIGDNFDSLTDNNSNNTKIQLCDEKSNGITCSMILMLYTDLINRADIQVKNSSTHSSITFTFRDKVVNLSQNEVSKRIIIYFDPVGLYKIETNAGVVFENSSFNFRGSLKDGTIITTDGTLINDLDLAGCNLINVETGKIETVSGQCLTPTNP